MKYIARVILNFNVLYIPLLALGVLVGNLASEVEGGRAAFLIN